MTSYLIRRFIQMGIVVLVATMAIYGILNLAPGGPMAGLNQIGDRRARFSEADKARLAAYLGLDKPLVLRYLVWLLGDDWLGADYMSLSLRPTDGVRFWAAPGIAYAAGGYPIWFAGEQTGTRESDGLPIITATKVWIRPTGEQPAEAVAASIIKVDGGDMSVDVTGNPQDVVVSTSPETEWEGVDRAGVAGWQLGQCLVALRPVRASRAPRPFPRNQPRRRTARLRHVMVRCKRPTDH